MGNDPNQMSQSDYAHALQAKWFRGFFRRQLMGQMNKVEGFVPKSPTSPKGPSLSLVPSNDGDAA